MPWESTSDTRSQATLFAFSLAPPKPPSACPLSADEWERADRFRSALDRSRWIMARTGLRMLLAARLSCDPASLSFAEGEYGKPHLPEAPDLDFSLSHAGNLALLGISDAGPVGVDLEPRSREDTLEECAQSICSPDENPPAGGLLKIWCAKEAYLKALGRGLSLPPHTITLEWNPDGQATVRDDPRFRIHFPTGLPKFYTAVALPAGIPCPDISVLPADFFA